MPESAVEVTRGLIQAVRPALLGLVLPTIEDKDDRVIIMMDSSEVASRFTIGALVTTIRAGSRWYYGHFRPWDDRRYKKGENLSYKRVADRSQDLKSLVDYLSIADQCPGLLRSISTPSLSQSVLSSPNDTRSNPDLQEFRTWSKKDFERLLRTAVAVTVSVGVSERDPENIALIHDTDQLFEPSKFDSAQNWICCFATAVFDVPQPIALVTKGLIQDPLVAKAMLGLPDFVAGGTGSFLSESEKLYGIAEGLCVPAPDSLTAKDLAIMSWLGQRTQRLGKVSLSYGFESGTCHLHQISV